MSSVREPFLSIIVPFHNSERKCAPLLANLGTLKPADQVELIFVDDGSTDGTMSLLRDFAASSKLEVTLIDRPNGGPGAARNSGLDHASGQWIWFVDSDDTIDPLAIEIARNSDWPSVDAIAWELEHPDPGVACTIAPGLHRTDDGPALPEAMEMLPAKWFARTFLERTGLRFPENCVYEATPIENFVLPLLLTSYFKSDFKAYGAIDGPSVTRGTGSELRRLDRLRTIPLGRSFVERAQLTPEQRLPFDHSFIRLFLWHSIRLSALPGRSWIMALRVMRQFRDEASTFRIQLDPFDVYPGRVRSRLVARLLWTLSPLLPPQRPYFDAIRNDVWGREIEWMPPSMPNRWLEV